MAKTVGASGPRAGEAVLDGASSVGWQVGLPRELGRLGRWIQGRLVVDPPADLEFIPATRYLESDVLRGAIETFREPLVGSDGERSRPPGEDFELAVAASRFARRYAGPMTAVALTGLAVGVGLDVSAQRCSLALGPGGHYLVLLDAPAGTVLSCAERPSSWITDGPRVDTVEELRRGVWEKLYGAHIAPLYARVHELTGASEALLWASAAEYASMVPEDAEKYLSQDESVPYLADGKALFDAADLPGVPGPSPLHDALVWLPVEGYPFSTVQTRGLCCLSYLMEGRDGFLCHTCPYLPLPDRAALVSELLTSSTDGPAAARSQEIGRERPSYRRLRGLDT
jgi:hypothetical protein